MNDLVSRIATNVGVDPDVAAKASAPFWNFCSRKVLRTRSRKCWQPFPALQT